MFKRKMILEYDASQYNRKQYRLLRNEIKNNNIDEEFLRRVADPKNSESKMLNLFVVYKLYRLTPDMMEYLFNLDESMVFTAVYIARAFTHGITADEITKLLYDRMKSPNEACMSINVYIKQHSRGLDKTLLRYATFNEEDIDSVVEGEVVKYED